MGKVTLSGITGQMIPIPLQTASAYHTAFSGLGSSVKRKCFVLTHDRDSFDMFLALGVDDEDKDVNFIFVEKVEDMDDGSYGGRIRLLNDFFLNPNLDSILKFLDKQLDYTKRRGNVVNISMTGGYVGGVTTSPTSILNVRSAGIVGIGAITP